MASQNTAAQSSESIRNPLNRYGFNELEAIDGETYEEFSQLYQSILERRNKRWSFVTKQNSKIQKNTLIKRFVRKGIPPTMRAQMWMLFSGAEDRMKSRPGYYKQLLSQNHDKKLIDVINTDIPRTFPENVYFQHVQTADSKVGQLHNILVAYGTAYPHVGYCQGLNYVAALLLLVIPNEEQAFWLLDAMVGKDSIVPAYYHPEMKALKRDCFVLNELIKEKAPSVSKVLESENVSFILVCTKWFICLYGDLLPIETLMRIWDCLFFEGDKILFRVAITLIKINESKLAECKSFPEIVTVFQGMINTKNTLFCHEFMKQIFKLPGTLSQRKVKTLRSRYKPES